ncbi:7-carboxy-7-deazaguanine synthase QueE [Pantoea sp. SoEX]|uniref:7-carboxy-7-deazaguanine synthase QueE n=1 Tax=Pantoea sp. SoEX TaxID=2576763 RepID=UPI00135AA6CE|nr:7-carboxy-7-deazaguanine synthase QueE [Pantoea sp. SoEX]MXP51222.1 7-carboxy-7-deazaguanine synthase QueE [Pantoea sp. SoEX]
MIYPINEIFHTIQGEGLYTGIPAIFIRFQGCPVNCSWCDTKYTWKKLKSRIGLLEDILSKKTENNIWCYLSSTFIVKIIERQKWNINHIVITGGEPSIYDLRPLTFALEKAGFFCQLETSGTYKIYCSEKTWVTVSPKINVNKDYPILSQPLFRSDEIKYLVENENDINLLDSILLQVNDNKKRIISLQPVSCSQIATDICIKNCISHNWHLSIQTHKYLSIK